MAIGSRTIAYVTQLSRQRGRAIHPQDGIEPVRRFTVLAGERQLRAAGARGHSYEPQVSKSKIRLLLFSKSQDSCYRLAEAGWNARSRTTGEDCR